MAFNCFHPSGAAAICLVFLATALPSVTAAATKAGAHAGVTPVQKVLQMLDSMRLKGQEAKHQEEVAFAKFHEWCDGVRAEKARSIKAGAEQIEQLSAHIAKAKSDAEVLGSEVADLDAAVARARAEAAKATELRKGEHSDYLVQQQDLSESIDACSRAVLALKARSADVPESLAQLRSLATASAHAKAALQSFLETRTADFGTPEANAYEFQSGSVVDLIEKLGSKFKAQLLAAEKAEMSAKANYQMLMQNLQDNMKADKDVASKKTAAKAGRLQDAAEAREDKATAEKVRAEDEKTLSDTLGECHARSAEFELNQNMRAEEVKAIKTAMKILSSDEVAGHADTHLPSAASLQQMWRTSFAQVQSSPSSREVQAQHRAAAYLQGRADKLDSKQLALVASRMTGDAFAKVKKMIQELIFKLSEQANEEADHHAYCTAELATNKQRRDNKMAEVDELSATTERLTADTTQLSFEIQQLSDALAELQGQRAEAERLRVEEKAANQKAISDAKEGQAAVERAIQILRAFYAKAADATSFVQADSQSVYSSGRRGAAPYKGMQDESTGILGMLDVVLSDFSRLETQTSGAEDQAQAAHDKFMDESAQDMEVKSADRSHKEAKRQQTGELLRSAKRELELTEGELSSHLDYYNRLKADCVDAGMSYSERKKAREDEIQSLKEALRILNQEDIA